MKKLGNIKQIVSAYDVVFLNGAESGKNCILVHTGELEVLFNKDNALDISWVKYKGRNISFLSKNGINSVSGTFAEKFEGGFLYTCGMDNVSSCVENKPIHGSLHYRQASEVYHREENGTIVVGGKVRQTALFGSDLVLNREYTVSENGIRISDIVSNEGYTADKYVLLYHINFGYPFLDEDLKAEMPIIKSEGLTEYARSRKNSQLLITPPADGGEEEVFYNYLADGRVKLKNEKIGVTCEMRYGTDDFPVTLQWKSMISGDYALGIEPSVTRFDDFQMRSLPPRGKRLYRIDILFDEAGEIFPQKDKAVSV